MKQRITPTLLLFVMLAAIGCGSPSQKAYDTRLFFNGAVKEMVDLRTQKKFPDPGYEIAAITANAIAPQLDELDRAATEAEAAGPTDTIQSHYHFSAVLRSVTSAIREFTAKLMAQREVLRVREASHGR